MVLSKIIKRLNDGKDPHENLEDLPVPTEATPTKQEIKNLESFIKKQRRNRAT